MKNKTYHEKTLNNIKKIKTTENVVLDDVVSCAKMLSNDLKRVLRECNELNDKLKKSKDKNNNQI